MAETFALCDECACEVINGDDSARDFYDLSEDARALRDASIEAMGYVCEVRREDIGCFACFVCDDISYGNASIMEKV